MTTLAETEILCPCCGSTYESIGWASTNTLGPFSTDLHTRASGSDPLRYEAHTCPKCGYTIPWGEEFDIPPVSDEVKILVRNNITPIIQERRISHRLKYEFLAWIAEWRGKTPYEIGFYYLKAAWCADDCHAKDDEMYYRSQAVKYFELELKDPHPGKKYECAVLFYLIGENYRRLGETGKADVWFSKVPKMVKKEKKNYWIAKLAKQQRKNPKEFIEEGQFNYNDEHRLIVRWYEGIRLYYNRLLGRAP